MSGGIKEYQGVFQVYFVSETAQVELKSDRGEAPAAVPVQEERLGVPGVRPAFVKVDQQADEERLARLAVDVVAVRLRPRRRRREGAGIRVHAVGALL